MLSGKVTGGLGDVLEKDDKVVDVVQQIKPILEEQSKIKFESIEVLHYIPQVVAGRNYFVKVSFSSPLYPIDRATLVPSSC